MADFKKMKGKFSKRTVNRFINYITDVWILRCDTLEYLGSKYKNLSKGTILETLQEESEAYIEELNNGSYLLYTKKFIDCDWFVVKTTDGRECIIDLDSFYDRLDSCLDEINKQMAAI